MIDIFFCRGGLHASPRAATLLFATVALSAITVAAQGESAWGQWGQNPQHTGNVSVAGQAPQAKLADQVFDPFVSLETSESRGSLLMHYQAVLASGNNIFMEIKSGTYASCNPPGSGTPEEA